MRISSAFALNCLVLGVLVVGPQLSSLTGPSDDIFDKVSARMDCLMALAATIWMSLGFFLAFFLRRKPFRELQSPGKFLLVAVLPALLFATTFLIKPAPEAYSQLGEAFGVLAPLIMCLTTFLFGSFVYALIARELKRRMKESENSK